MYEGVRGPYPYPTTHFTHPRTPLTHTLRPLTPTPQRYAIGANQTVINSVYPELIPMIVAENEGTKGPIDVFNGQCAQYETPKPQTPNPKSQIPNPKFQTPNP